MGKHITLDEIKKLIDSFPERKDTEPFRFIGILPPPFGKIRCYNGMDLIGSKKAIKWLNNNTK